MQWLHYGRYLHERMRGKPTQYITRKQEFYGREFRVTPDVLIPRPETEHIVEIALEVACDACRILDIGTDSGRARRYAEAWNSAPKPGPPISLASGRGSCRWRMPRTLSADRPFRGVRPDSPPLGRTAMDLIVSNPPYVPRHTARRPPARGARFRAACRSLRRGDGLRTLRAHRGRMPRACCVPAGWLIMELGFGTVNRVERMVANWSEVRVLPDLAGIPRVIAARR